MDNNHAVGELHGAGECATSPSMSEGRSRFESDIVEPKCSFVVSPSASFDDYQRSRPRFAVLIDGENVGARFADDLFRRVSMLGEPTHCLIYGDWRGQKGKQWKNIANSRIGASLIQPLTEPGAKNATDMSMVIGAMDLLHSNEFEGFCLVSADADFVPLVRRLQQEGLWVYGYAGGRPSRALAGSCDRFFSLVPARSGVSGVLRKVEYANLVLLVEALTLHEDDDGLANLSAVGQHLSRTSAAYRENRWGFASLTKLLRATGQCCVEESHGRRSVRRISNATTLTQAIIGKQQSEFRAEHEIANSKPVVQCSALLDVAERP